VTFSSLFSLRDTLPSRSSTIIGGFAEKVINASLKGDFASRASTGLGEIAGRMGSVEKGLRDSRKLSPPIEPKTL
jgi:hypothetical protein